MKQKLINTILNLQVIKSHDVIKYSLAIKIIKELSKLTSVESSHDAGDDSFAGNEIPYDYDKYIINGNEIILTSFPDWDNYQTDYGLRVNGNYFKLIEN